MTLVAAGLVASAVSLALRLRRAEDDARRQLLWIASSAAALAFGVAVDPGGPTDPRGGGELAGRLAVAPRPLRVPAGVAVAVLRHRLARDRPHRQPGAGADHGHGLAALGYVLVVVLVGLVVDGSTGGFWPSLVATALVALAFQPLRRRVVGVADRLAFGRAAAPYEALADFSRRLGDSPDPATCCRGGRCRRRAPSTHAGPTALLHVESWSGPVSGLAAAGRARPGRLRAGDAGARPRRAARLDHRRDALRPPLRPRTSGCSPISPIRPAWPSVTPG